MRRVALLAARVTRRRRVGSRIWRSEVVYHAAFQDFAVLRLLAVLLQRQSELVRKFELQHDAAGGNLLIVMPCHVHKRRTTTRAAFASR